MDEIVLREKEKPYVKTLPRKPDKLLSSTVPYVGLLRATLGETLSVGMCEKIKNNFHYEDIFHFPNSFKESVIKKIKQTVLAIEDVQEDDDNSQSIQKKEETKSK